MEINKKRFTISVARKLLYMLEGKTLPSSSLPRWIVDELRIEGLITGITNGSRVSYRLTDSVAFGRYISDNDVEMRTNVCVIQDTTALKVFGYCNEDVIGEKIKVKSWKGTTKLTVVGITENTDSSSTEVLYRRRQMSAWTRYLKFVLACKTMGGQ